MVIFGTAIVAFCMLAGMLLGELVGVLTGLGSNVGSVGFAMVLMLLLTNYVFPSEQMHPNTVSGITFWQQMYIPVVVAMSASQNVTQAVSGGAAAILAGLLAVAAAFAALPLMNRLLGGEAEQ